MKGKYWKYGFFAAAAMLLFGSMPAVSAEEAKSNLADEDDVYNILLIGTDRRDESWNGNSDVMIVATINPAAEKLCLTSFMRDLYADIPDYGVHKLNYAYAAGGAEALEATLESNYQVEVDNYAVVDFEAMSEVIDLAGGVEITLTDGEAEILNGYLISMDAEEDSLPGGGTYQLNGMQAVAYMRNRSIGNDYERTQRQRNVLRSLFESVGELETDELMKLATETMGLIEHDIDMFDLLGLLKYIPKCLTYELEEARVPFDDLYYSENEMLVPDFEATTERLREIIYEGESTEMSASAEAESETE